MRAKPIETFAIWAAERSLQGHNHKERACPVSFLLPEQALSAYIRAALIASL